MGICVQLNKETNIAASLGSRAAIAVLKSCPCSKTFLGGIQPSLGGSLGEPSPPCITGAVRSRNTLLISWEEFQAQKALYPAVSYKREGGEKRRAHTPIHKSDSLRTDWVLSSSLGCLPCLCQVLHSPLRLLLSHLNSFLIGQEPSDQQSPVADLHVFVY